jgi:YVTN family beta-propeller protein
LTHKNRGWFLRPRIQNRDNKSSLHRVFSCLALPPMLVALWCVPATACHLFVPTHKSNSVAVIDPWSDHLLAVIPVQFQPLAVAITPNGAFAYVTNSGWPVGSNSVSVIDTATNTVVATIPVGNFPVGVVVTPNGAFAYVANLNSNSVSVISTVTNTVTTTVLLAFGSSGPWGLAITPNGAFAYITNQSSDNVSVINTATNTVVATVPVVNG